MYCPFCGNMLPDTAKFCNQCGNGLTQQAQQHQKNNTASKHTKVKEVYRGSKIVKVAKVIATLAVAGGIVTVLWRPVIQPVLMSKTIGPEDLTGYTSEYNKDNNLSEDSDFKNGKWVREDGKAVIYIGHGEDSNLFDFELYASKQDSLDEYLLQDKAKKESSFVKNSNIKAMAYYKKTVGEKVQENISFSALADEEAIQITTDESWKNTNVGKQTPDGVYYRIRKEWFWTNEESGIYSFEFTPDEKLDEKQEEVPDTEKGQPEISVEKEEINIGPVILDGPVIEVEPPAANSGETPIRIADQKEKIEEELVKEILDEGVYLNFEGVYYVVEADVESFDQFFEYYYDDCEYEPDKEICIGTQEGLLVAQARYDSLAKLKNRNYGKTKWSFSKNMDILPDFSYMWFEEGGEYTTEVPLTNMTYEIGYRINEFSMDSSNNRVICETSINAEDPSVYCVIGSYVFEDPDGNSIDRELKYNINIYFKKDGTVEAEGFMTLFGQGSEYIKYWLQMSAVEAQTEGKIASEFNFKALMEPFYSFPNLEADSLEFSEDKDTSILATDDLTGSVNYEYSTE